MRVAVLGPAAAMVSWPAAGGAQSWVEVGRNAPFGLWYRAVRRGDRWEARVTGLAPSTMYRLRIDGVGRSTLKTEPIGWRTRASVDRARLRVEGEPLFPILVWSQCPESYARLIELGVNVFAGDCDEVPAHRLLAALAGRAYAALPAEEALRGVDGRGLIGWTYRDEPDAAGIPPSALPALPDPATSGRLRVFTSTYHFYRRAPALPGMSRAVYKPYWSRADLVGFDLYPLEKLCGDPTIGLRTVYDAQRQLVRDVRPKPTFQWLETGPLERECAGSARHVTPATLRAEVWLALAGGARGIGYFTHTWWPWQRFDVAPDVEQEIARTNASLASLAPVLAAPPIRLPRGRGSSVVAGARAFNGALYVIAVNPSFAPVAGRVRVPGAGFTSFTVLGEHRRVVSARSAILDGFGPLGVHVYVAAPRGAPPGTDS